MLIGRQRVGAAAGPSCLAGLGAAGPEILRGRYRLGFRCCRWKGTEREGTEPQSPGVFNLHLKPFDSGQLFAKAEEGFQ